LLGLAAGLGIMLAMHKPEQPPGPGANLIRNAGFERDTRFWQEWQPGTTIVTRTRATLHLGSASLRAAALGTSRYGVHELWIPAAPTRGDRFSLSLWLKGDASSQGKRVIVQVKLAPPSGAGGGLDESVSSPTATIISRSVRLTATWRRFSASATATTSSAAAFDLLVVAESDIASGDAFYLDDVKLVRNPSTHRSAGRRGSGRT